MPKAGLWYQDVVGAVEQALDPGAQIRVGQWIEGPDGRRDLDVEVRGTVDGQPRFVLIECKDWRKKVGIETIDALDSKMGDLAADAAVIYSNSGFTSSALRKANRKGIQACSALKHGDDRIRVALHAEFFARRFSVRQSVVTLYPAPSTTWAPPANWTLLDVLYENQRIADWLGKDVGTVLAESPSAESLSIEYVFKEPTKLSVKDTTVYAGAMGLQLTGTWHWLSQKVRLDVSEGLFNHLRREIKVPGQHSIIVGAFDMEGWKVAEQPPLLDGLDLGALRLALLMVQWPAVADPSKIPDLGPAVSERRIRLDQSSAHTAA